MNLTNQAIKTLVSTLFKDSKGQPFQLTDGQCEIFKSVINPNIKWLWMSAPTRYGKTETLALALIYLAVFHHLKLPIVGGSQEKAMKIMEYVVQHIGDHPSLFNGLLNIGTDSHDVEMLKVRMAKDALRWSSGGWIYVTSIDSRSISKEGEKVVGEGGDIVILEEAGLIKRPEQFSKIVRMLEGDWGKLVMSGNCIEHSVFEKAYKNPLYKKVRITLDQAVAEGRYDAKRLEQQKTQTTSKDWKRYYLVEFPEANEFTYFKPKIYQYLPKGLQYFGAVDLALGESKKGSLVGMTILGKAKDGQVYEVESLGLHIKPEETIRTLFNFQYKFERFGVETVQFQKYFFMELEKKSKAEGLYIPFMPITQSKKKEERIESMEPIINTGQILFKGTGELWDEMQDYPDAEHMDVLDSLEMAWRTMGNSSIDFAFV